MGSPDFEYLKKCMWERYFRRPEIPLLLGVLGSWMTFKKAEMEKTLKNGLIMIETNPLNRNWSHFVILSGLTLHQFQKKLLLRNLDQFSSLQSFAKFISFWGRSQTTLTRFWGFFLPTYPPSVDILYDMNVDKKWTF